MQIEIASPPAKPWPRLGRAAAARLTLPMTILFTLLFELALAERKYALFGGGFGQSQALDAPLEIAAFAAALLACQTLLFYLLYRLVRRLHGRRADTPLFHLNFLFLIGLGAAGAVAAKYHALSYFSDAMSFQIVRNLGGGTIAGALLYTLSEVGLVLLSAAGVLLAYAAALYLLRRRWRDSASLPDLNRLSPRRLLLAAAVLPLLLFAANRVDDARAALARLNSVIVFTALLDQATDFDRDGWSWFSHPLDRQPFDGSRHPYALDVPGNGIDEDGYGGDLVLGAEPAPTAPAFAGRRRHVVLVVLESTRADAVGKRIGGRPVAPVLEALATRGTVAREAYSHVGFTAFSLKSLFTGELAPADDRRSLVRDFRANGYRVGIFSGLAEDFGGIAAVTGTRHGDIFVDAETLKEERGFGFAATPSLYVDGRLLLREFDRHLGRPEAWATPHFLYFNFQSAHFPYAAPGMDSILPGEPIPRGRIGAANREWVARTYWNAIAYNDRLLGELLGRLRRLGVLDDTLVVVTSDHGEALFEDGFLGHGHALDEIQTRIPFVLGDPQVELPSPIGLADMRAIILRAAGADIPAPRTDAVFQYLGSIDRPGAIGLVRAGGERILFDLFSESVWTSASGRWTGYSRLSASERAAADALIDEWARQRWRRRNME